MPNKYAEMQKYTRYLRKWAESNDSSDSYGQSPATFQEWQSLKEQGFQPEEDYVVIGGFMGGCFASIGVNNDDVIRTPHLHVVGNDEKDIACVGLLEAVYIPHDDEAGELDDEQKAGLLELFRSVVGYRKFREAGITHWDYACLTWNYNNETQISEDTTMPDYEGL
jgi:hypothetical protein